MQEHPLLKRKIYLFSRMQFVKFLILLLLIGAFHFEVFPQNSQPDTVGDFELVKCDLNEKNLRGQNHKGCFTKANFRRTHFQKKQSFANRNFLSDVDFSIAKFYGEANFMGATFDQGVKFSGTRFEDVSKFYEVRFKGKSHFGSTDFQGNSDFLRSEFEGPVSFVNTKFKEAPDFIEVKFKDDVSFERTLLSDGTDFRDAEFFGEVNFSYANIGKCSFQNILLPKRLIFHETTLSRLLDLSFVRNNENARAPIVLSKTPIDSLKFDYSQFFLINGTIRIPYPFLKKGSEREMKIVSKEEIEKMYFDIMRMQKRYNYVEGYQYADLDYQKWKLSTGFFYEKFIILPIKKRWDNFGYNKDLIFTNTFILFSIFFLITISLFPYLVTKVYNPASLKGLKDSLNKNRHDYKKLIQYLRLIPYAFYYTLIIFFGLRMELNNFMIDGNPNHHSYNLKKKLLGGYILVMYAVGLICTAYLARYVISS
ncbi:MAG: pentapeptide repeat-containing protein [Bacteroidia bacterium]|nr:pentapeptide repeat-containing protein [Bacteroidia bacterium]